MDRRRRLAVAAATGAAGMLALTGCGGSTSSSPSESTAASMASSTSTTSSELTVIAGNGSPFCGEAASALQKLYHLNAIVPGGGTTLAGIKQLMSQDVTTIDNLESVAPAAISADFHTLRTAFDAVNVKVQAATAIQDLSGAFQPLQTQAVTTANNHLSRYATTTCGIGTVTASST